MRNKIVFPDKDLPLKRDVGMVGKLVGEMLAEQCGRPFFERVEQARHAAIARRAGAAHEGGEGNSLQSLCEGLPATEAAELVRAFATYFQAVNLAEKVHRIRRRREYLRRGDEAQPRSLEEALLTLREAGWEAVQAYELLLKTCVEPVFTAHPTEAVRRSLLQKQQEIARHLVAAMDPSLTPHELSALREQIRAGITSGWQTEEHPNERLTVADERESVLFFVTDVLYRIVPAFYEAVAEAFVRVFGAAETERSLEGLLRFASWVGGDMDGNPNVGADTIRETLERHRELVLRRYVVEAQSLARKLSQSVHRVGIDPELRRRNEACRTEFPELAPIVHRRHQDMYYRQFLSLVAGRLQATRTAAVGGYDTAAEFVGDIELVANSLLNHQGRRAGWFGVRRLLRRAQTFGFHLATLDVRQDSLVHRRAIGEGLGRADWLDLEPAERCAAIRTAWEAGSTPVATDVAELADSLDVFAAIRQARATYGPRAIGPFIVSMTQTAEDVLGVLILARWADLLENEQVPLDVAPLFETVDDLERAPAVMRELLDDPLYAAHLDSRGREQIIMIGYSDSNKDGGIAAARWALQCGQRALVEALADDDLQLTFFHGRGGTISRGGGKVSQAIGAAPDGALQGHLRVTEQGEMINAKYGLRGIAMRTLEEATGAVVLKTGLPNRSAAPDPAWRQVMDDIAAASRELYRASVHDDLDFFRYFRQATPIDVIERMQIGSRPASRRSGDGINNLRAIPWVFAWMQSRHGFPGYYGVGTGLAHAEARYGAQLLRDMTRRWPFMRALIADVEMVLAKADMDIAVRYAQLADPELQPIYTRIKDEFDLTCRMIKSLTGAERLLAREPALQRSILLRNPYVDPMSLLQIDLLRRWRESNREDAELLNALLATINGIAQGMQNTG